MLPLYLASRSWLERNRGAYGRRSPLDRRALASAEELGHLEWQAWAHYVLGRALLEAGGRADAIPILERAWETATDGGAIAMQVRAGGFLAVALLGAGDHDGARGSRRLRLTVSVRSPSPTAASSCTEPTPCWRSLARPRGSGCRIGPGSRGLDRRAGRACRWIEVAARVTSSGLACRCRMVPTTTRRSPLSER